MPQDKMRRTLLDRVQMYEFAVIEANLYLDTHPQDQDALKYHDKYANLLEQAKAEYEKQFGTLNPMKANNGTRWSWVDDPWPWDLNADQEKGGVSDVDL